MFVFPHHSYFGRSEISINVKLQKAAHFDQSHACLPDLLNFENAISTAALGFDCTFHMSKFRFCFGALLSRVFYCIVCFSSAIFVVILPILRVSTTLLYTISCTPPHLVHNLTFASASRALLQLNLDQSICVPPPHHSQTFCIKPSWYRSNQHPSKHRHGQRFRPVSSLIRSGLPSALFWHKSHLFNPALSCVEPR